MKRLILVSLALTVAGGRAWAEGVSNGGGGGTAVVCRGEDGAIRRSTLLDLFEAATVFGFRVATASGDIVKDYFNASVHGYYLEGTTNIGGYERAMIDASLQRFFDHAVMTGPLPRLDDTGPVASLPEGCALEQLAVFRDPEPGRVEINREIWQSLDSVNRAALVTHELIYHRERRYFERTSQTARAAVAHVYAVSGVPPLLEGVPAGAYSCVSEDPRYIGVDLLAVRGVKSSRFSSFRVFQSGEGTRLQFLQLAGRSMMTKTAVDIPDLAFTFEPRPTGDELRQVLVAAAPAMDLAVEIPLENPVRKNWRIQLVYKTGEPIRLRVKAAGALLSEEFITGCD